MDIFTEVLQSFGIKDFDQLNSVEQETLRGWVDKVEKAQITLDDIKNGVTAMRSALEMELINYENKKTKDLFLKARLKNLVLLETILTRPERARAALDSYLIRGKVQP